MRPFLRCALLTGFLLTPGCFHYRPVGAPPPSGAAVRIVLRSSMEVTTVGTGEARQVHPGIFEVSGVIAAAAADTVAITLGEIRDIVGVVSIARGRTALVPTVAIARIEQRELASGKTLLVGLGAVTILSAAVLILLIRAIGFQS